MCSHIRWEQKVASEEHNVLMTETSKNQKVNSYKIAQYGYVDDSREILYKLGSLSDNGLVESIEHPKLQEPKAFKDSLDEEDYKILEKASLVDTMKITITIDGEEKTILILWTIGVQDFKYFNNKFDKYSITLESMSVKPEEEIKI